MIDIEDRLKSLIASVGGQVVSEEDNQLQLVDSTWHEQELTHMLVAV